MMTEEMDRPTSFDSPESSTIAGASYDPGQQVMIVTFTHGKAYRYGGITPAIWADFHDATSKGAHFGRHIRPHHAGVIHDLP